MTYAAQVAIAADRYTPCVRTITFRGLDLTGVALRMQARLHGDTPGSPLFDLQNVSNAQAQGLKLVSVDIANGYPVSVVQIRINETTIEGLPYSGELGDATAVEYDMQGTLGGDKRVLMRGTFSIGAGVTGADNAPFNRPFGYGATASASGMRTGATLTYGETRIDITVDGADLVAPLAAKAQEALDRINEFTTGPAGPADAFRINLEKLRSAAITDRKSEFDYSTWYWTPGDFSGKIDDVNYVKANSTAVADGAWVRKIEAATQPSSGAAASIVSAATPTGEIVLKPATYTLGATAAFTDSVKIQGTRGTRGGSSLDAAGDVPALSWSASGGDDRNGPLLSNFTIYNRQGIAIGDRAGAIADGGGQTVFHYSVMQRLNVIDPLSSDANRNENSIGVSQTKAFNGLLSFCEVQGFRIGVLFNGADINAIFGGRIAGWSRYGILETSAGSFGSQNLILGVDVLGSSKIANGASYKSTGRHSSLISNYFEPQGAMVPGAGFIDFSFAGVPAYGGNTPGQILSIFAIGNRIDSQGLGSFVYRMCPTDARSVVLIGRQTSDASTTPSYFCDAPGNRMDVIPMHSGLRARQYLISEVTMGAEWHGHQDEPGVTFGNGGFSVNARNKAAFPYTTIVTGRPAYVAHQGDTLVIPAGNAGQPIPIFPGGYGGNRFFDNGSAYEIVILARSLSAAGDTLSLQQCGVTDAGAGFGTSYETLPLTNQFRELRFVVPGRPANYQAVGFHIQSATSMGTIYFHAYWREIRGSFDKPLRIGARFYWTDTAGFLRNSATAPTADNSGQVVGPYTPGA